MRIVSRACRGNDLANWGSEDARTGFALRIGWNGVDGTAGDLPKEGPTAVGADGGPGFQRSLFLGAEFDGRL